MVRALGNSPITARGVLELLWDHCYEAGEDYVGTSDDIEDIVGWTGERGMVTRALADAGAPEGHGFLEPVSDVDGVPGAIDQAGLLTRYRVHDLWHHAPDYVRKRRERELERVGKIDPAKQRRTTDRQTAPNGGHRPPPSDRQDGDVRPPSPSRSPSPSPVKSPEPRGDSGPAAVFLEFPVTGPKGPTWPLSEAHIAEWAGLYEGLDVRAECRKAFAWVQAKPNRKKSYGGMKAFLVNWFNRAIDRGDPRRGELPEIASAPGRDDTAQRKYGGFPVRGDR